MRLRLGFMDGCLISYLVRNSRGISGENLEHAQFRTALLVARHGHVQLSPFRHKDRRTRDRTGRDVRDTLVMISVDLLGDIDEALAAGRIDAPWGRAERKAVENPRRGHGR